MRVWVEHGSSTWDSTAWESGSSMDHQLGILQCESLGRAWIIKPGNSAAWNWEFGLSMDHWTWGLCCVKLHESVGWAWIIKLRILLHESFGLSMDHQNWEFCCMQLTESLGWAWIKPGACATWNCMKVWFQHGSILGLLPAWNWEYVMIIAQTWRFFCMKLTASLGWAWTVKPGDSAAWNWEFGLSTD